MAVSTGTVNKRYISAISFFDQREIEKSVVDIQNEDDFLDIMSLTGRYEPVDAWDYHNFVNDALFVVGDTTGATVGGSGTATVTTTLTAGTSGFARLYDTVIFPNGKQGIITAATLDGTDDLTIKSVDGSNLTHTTGQKLAFISNAQVEESDAPASQRYSWTKYLNKIQIFRESDVISDVQKAAKLEVNFNGQPYVMYVQHAKKLQKLRGQIAAQCIAGKMSTYSFSDASPAVADASGDTFQTTRGIDDYVGTYGVSDTLASAPTVTLVDLRDLISQLIAVKAPKDYMIWSGSVAGTHYDEALKGLGSSGVTSARLNIDGRSVDLEVDSFRFGGFKFQKMVLPILDHPQLFNFTGSAGINKNAYFVPSGKVKTEMGAGMLPRIRMRYMPVPAEGSQGNSIIFESHQGLLAPTPVGRTANFTCDWMTYQGLEVLGAQHFAKQQVLA
jgi:hypothetical protein